MNDINSKAHELKDIIESEPLVKEYRRVEALYKESKEIKQILRNIEKASNDKDYALRKELIEKFNNHPLVSNYMNLKEEVHDYLKQISNSLNI